MGYETEMHGQEELLNGRALATVRVKRQGRNEESLSIYFRPVNKRTKSAVRIGQGEYDANTFIALYQNNNLMVLSRKQVNNMMRYFSEFYETGASAESQLPQPDTTAR